VHRARLITGEEVAVKLQYPGLKAMVGADLSTMKVLSE
jgi:predicted unusual protein kinase regulating ubiquinone biosynthesis (AarF/ABC1/UbiB family)